MNPEVNSMQKYRYTDSGDSDNPWRLTPEEAQELEAIRRDAMLRHEAKRKAARRRGRMDYPMLPYECSWAYEQEFRTKRRYG